jgi:two-component system, sensor histidine kinase and response regulator
MNATILIVEDDEDLRPSIESVLADRGYTVYAAPEGQTALEMLQNADWRPDLIVSDIMMPRMNGYEFFEAVHQIPELRVIPFIFLTALGSKNDVQAARRMGIDDYLVKPFEPDDFILAVENKLRRAADMRARAATELDDARRTMVQLLSHELRTPLTYVSGGWQLLTEGLNPAALDEETQMSLGLIGSGTARLTRLTEQMVLFAQLTTGHAGLQLQTVGAPVNMRTLTEEMVQYLHNLIEERGTKVNVRIAQGQLYVFGVAEILAGGLSEVIRNAISYSPEGSPIYIDVYQDDHGIIFEVSDQGYGIVPEDLPNIWKVLVQSERSRREQQGAGMGLPIAKRTVEAHGGSITLDSIVNRGTRVIVRLPAY